jgi:hypothetical protein
MLAVSCASCLPMKDLPAWGVATILAVKLLGYYIFRGANAQKDQFRWGDAQRLVPQPHVKRIPDAQQQPGCHRFLHVFAIVWFFVLTVLWRGELHGFPR